MDKHFNDPFLNQIKVINSEFINCSDIALLKFGNIEFDNFLNSKFSEISSVKGNAGVLNLLFDSISSIKNSVFENCNIDGVTAPFIYSNGNFLNFHNISMTNVYSNVGYIIYDKGTSKKNNTVYITNSNFDDINSLIYGENIQIEIYNSEFRNINKINSYPVISSLVHSNNYLYNCVITDIKLFGTQLFDEESSVFIKDSIIENISTQYKSVFQITFNRLEFNHVNFNNINIYGDLNESSFINIKMGDNKNVLKFEDVNITNLNSNGQIINYTGNNIYIDFINVHCNNLISFSPLLKGNSENIYISINNSEFSNNKVLNRSDQRLIHLEHSIYISINNSKFLDNETGILKFDNIRNLNLTLIDSKYKRNKCNGNGCIININDDLEKYDLKHISITRNEFEDNKSNTFGGVVYSNLYYSYDLSIKETKFSNNTAEVAGGVIFFEQIGEAIKNVVAYYKNSINTHKNQFINNKAKSHGNDFATHPSIFSISNVKDNTNITYSGNPVHFTLELIDDLGNKVEDREKYYSDIGVELSLLDSNLEPVSSTYYISETITTFNNGRIIIDSDIFTLKYGKYFIHIVPKKNTFKSLYETYYDYPIIIQSCEENQIIHMDPQKGISCLNPVCFKNCSRIEYASECVKGENNLENDPQFNICKCKSGFKGDTCEIIDFYDVE
ncbi:hypothetical protein H8356DRAFT_1081023 [Neocallimastix lanati (nom. inval.)]|uniref:EGF-like domain-containing protein n=1 Tax=Neocallimastix californiae TaxID=1754190 RepID=A0A1Y2D6T5_9FUNG|nr:hypothetical protein H8356DRAFT_1081023 [Neocallimastix sp. JGI-2020a]ORY54786.1 hypothetical protein LY90DRAFT_646771 [Neocallimastix californiae]|eukprot:ORY54786.1 hypothetical protein LY90DRAFT_646771 [Neocallimastix californiae]